MGAVNSTITKRKGIVKQLIDEFDKWVVNRSQLSIGKRVLYLFIARKAQHIYFSLPKETKDLIDWCTEISLPFIDLTLYDEIVIVDDAIYYGSTFQKIQKLLLLCCVKQGVDLSRLQITSHPLVMAYEAIEIYSYDGYKELPIRDEILEIDDATKPYYINSFVDHIAASRRPYDIEAPIFNIQLKRTGFKESELVQAITHTLNSAFNQDFEWYETQRYNATEGEIFSSYSIVLDDLFPKSGVKLQPDFTKIRFVRDEDQNLLRISSYCINSIKDWSSLHEFDLFSQTFALGEIDDAINTIIFGPLSTEKLDALYQHPLFSQYITAYSSRQIADYEMKTAYQEFVRKSIVVLVNYLFSYFLFAKVFSVIRYKFVDYQRSLWDRLDHEALRGLVGPRLMPVLKKVLEHSHFDILGSHYPTAPCGSQDWIPMDLRRNYMSQYQKWVDNLNSRSKGSENSMGYINSQSLLFSAMHSNVEVVTRRETASSLTRLNFGESYDSLRDRMFLLDPARKFKDNNLSVHKALDIRIDAGSVVPHFELSIVSALDKVWSRQFRCGENDDMYLGQPIRNLFFVINEAQKHIKGSLYASDINFLLCVIIYLLNRKSANPITLWGLADAKVEPEDTLLGFKPSFALKESISGHDQEYQVDLLKYAEDLNLIQRDEDSEIKSNYTLYYKELSSGNILDVEAEEDLSDLIKEICALLVLHPYYSQNRREILNWIFPPKEEEVRDRLMAWKREFLTADISNPSVLARLEDEYIRLMAPIPMEGIELDKLRTQSWVNHSEIDQLKQRFSPWRFTFCIGYLSMYLLEIHYDQAPQLSDEDYQGALDELLEIDINSLDFDVNGISFSKWIKQPNPVNAIRKLPDSQIEQVVSRLVDYL